MLGIATLPLGSSVSPPKGNKHILGHRTKGFLFACLCKINKYIYEILALASP